MNRSMIPGEIDIAQFKLELSINKAQIREMQLNSQASNVNFEPVIPAFKKEAQNIAITKTQKMKIISDLDTEYCNKKS